MKFAIEGNQKFFFDNEGWIEFVGLLSQDQCEMTKEAVDRCLGRRLGRSANDLSDLSLSRLYCQGRDIWREEVQVKKAVCHSAIAEVAAELLEVRPLRLAFTQLLAAPVDPSLEGALGSVAVPCLEGECHLGRVGPVQGVCGALLLCLDPSQSELPKPFPGEAGAGTFLSVKQTVDFSPLQSAKGGAYLLVVYSQKSSVYVERSADPLTYCFKEQGYGYGDRLKDSTHPLLCR